jgi:hypothetical protein
VALDPSTTTLALAIWPRLLIAFGLLAFGFTRARAALGRRLAGATWDVLALGAVTEVAGTVVASAMALALVGHLRDWSWALLVAVVFAVIGRAHHREAPLHPPTPASGPAPSLPFLAVVWGAVLGRMLFSLRNPPADWDSFHYHLPMVAHWIQTATLGAPLRDPPVFGLYFPGNGEILQMWVGWAAHRDTLMPWASALALGLLALAVRRLALLAGARAPVAEGVGVAVGLTPGLLQLTLGTRIDALVALWFAVALLFGVRARRGDPGPQVAIMMIALGLLAGSKGNGPAYAALVLLVAITGHGAVARMRSMVGHPVHLAIALVTGGFWMARNAWMAGNPMFPAELKLGPWTFPGLMSTVDQFHTSQVMIWIEGFTGHNTPLKLWNFYGMAVGLLVPGLALWLATRGRDRGALLTPAPRDGQRTMLLIALACLTLYLFGPFSGSYEPSVGDRAPRLNLDNLRLVAPTLVAFAPLAAAGLSQAPLSGLVGTVIAALALVMLRRMAGHLVPGMVVVALALLAQRRWPYARWPRALRVAAPLALATAVTALVAVVEPGRERVFERGWDDYATRIHNLSSARLREVRALAGDGPVAVTGVDSWWGYYGRDFSGQPLYVPVVRKLRRRGEPWDFKPEARAAADRARWLANLERSGARVLVVGSPGEWCRERYVEGDWADADTARFTPVAGEWCDTVFVVRATGAASAPRAGDR